MTDEQRKRGHDINARAEPLFRELAHVEEKIRHFNKCLNDALSEQRKIEARLELLSEEKSAWYEEIFSAREA